jgi:4-hydroxy-tetrahydrodipicolinate reductase
MERSGFEVVAAVDIDPEKVGKDLAEVCGLDNARGVIVETNISAVLSRGEADVVTHCTSSSLEVIVPQLEAILDAGLPVVSTTEELSYPRYSQKELAEKIDLMAKEAGLAVVGTGVNPGYAMDTLPTVLTGACERVDSITVDRVQDASIRRLPFQQKIGAGLEPGVFRERADRLEIRHVGLTESVAMIAASLGWEMELITDAIEPRIATEPVSSKYMTVEAGQVAGLIQDAVGYRDGEPVIKLHMEAYLGSPESYDAVRIEGSPALYSRIEGGIHGDIATASVTVNTIPRVMAAPPGLQTMRDLPIPSWWSGA